LAPLVLALVLGDMAEGNFRNAMVLSDGSLSIFWSNGLVGSICGLAILMLFWPALSAGLRHLRRTTSHLPAE
jgi:putative tricarboxylic transport membrane protein